MFEASSSIVVDAKPEEVLEFVLDLRRYAEADTKITRIKDTHREGDEGHVRHGGRLRGLPGPVLTNRFRLEPWRELTFAAEHPLLRFHGRFQCTQVEEGTLVAHSERFEFRGPLRWIADPLFRNWLRRDLEDEMVRLRAIVERDQPA